MSFLCLFYVIFMSSLCLLHTQTHTHTGTKPIVRVAIEPKHATDLKHLEHAIKIVSASDPCVEYEIHRDTGEIVLATLGELHLEQCMERLQRRVREITVSEPLTMFKETCKKKELGKRVEVMTSNKRFRVVMSCSHHDNSSDVVSKKVNEYTILGPTSAPSNCLVIDQKTCDDLVLKTFRASVTSGFHLAASQGPLCHEPMQDVRFVIHTIVEEEDDDEEKEDEEQEKKNKKEDVYGPYAGQIVSAVRKACFESFLQAEPRIMEPWFRCVLQTMDTTLGKAYSVISRRRGKVLSEDMIEGTAIFVIESHIPVAESFGFASELRKSTSGAVMNPQLEFLCFKLLDVDPFFQPKTLEEREEHGEIVHGGQMVNLARNYIDSVRKRKGLFVSEKVVVSAEKQRTRSKKK